MNKKGVELTLQTIGVAILILLVITVLAIVFSQVLREGIMKLLGLSDETEKSITGNDCERLFSNRNCLTSDQCSSRQGKQLSGNWPDCKDGKVCCE